MASGNYDSEDDLLREALLAFADDSFGEDAFEEDVAAVEEALRELDAGDPGVDLDEAFRRIRERHGIVDPGA
jgi:hypothetical protein